MVSSSKRNAMDNANRIMKNKNKNKNNNMETPLLAKVEAFNGNGNSTGGIVSSDETFMEKYKIPLVILVVIVLILLGYTFSKIRS